MQQHDDDLARFVGAHTRVAAVPLVPELRFHRADEALALWATIEAGSPGAPFPFWAFPWAGGIALARYVLDNPGIVAGRRVFDLGTGGGLVACAAALAGATSVSANDIDPLAIAALRVNIELNGVTVTPVLEDLLGSPGHALFDDVEVVLAGDVAYESAMATRCFELLTRLAARGVEVYVGDLGRPYLPAVILEPLAAYDISVPHTLEDAAVKRTTVYRLMALPTG